MITENPLSVEERLGTPDFTGEWDNSVGIARGSFKMYIISKTFASLTENIHGFKIEGIIVDEVNEHGLAVFSGVMGVDAHSRKKVIRFTKNYSRGNNKVFFEGEAEDDPDVFKGTYSLPGTKLSSTFKLQRNLLSN